MFLAAVLLSVGGVMSAIASLEAVRPLRSNNPFYG